MIEYYRLAVPHSDRLRATFQIASEDDWEVSPCLAGNPGHGDDGRRLRNNLSVSVKHSKRDERLIFSWPWEPLVHESLIAEFEAQGVTGYRLRPANVRFRDGRLSDEYRQLVVVGWAGIAPEESGIHITGSCPGCHRTQYSGLVRDRVCALVERIKAAPVAGRASAIAAMFDLAETGEEQAYCVFDELLKLRRKGVLLAVELALHVLQVLSHWAAIWYRDPERERTRISATDKGNVRVKSTASRMPRWLPRQVLANSDSVSRVRPRPVVPASPESGGSARRLLGNGSRRSQRSAPFKIRTDTGRHRGDVARVHCMSESQGASPRGDAAGVPPEPRRPLRT